MRTIPICSRQGLAAAMIAAGLAMTGIGNSENPVPSVYVKKLPDRGAQKQKSKVPGKPLQASKGGGSQKEAPPAAPVAEARPVSPPGKELPEKKKPSLLSALGKRGKLRPAQEIPATTVAQPVKDARKLTDLTEKTPTPKKP